MTIADTQQEHATEQQNIMAMGELLSAHRQLTEQVMYQRDPKAIANQRQKNKYLARQRLNHLAKGQPYLELSILAGHDIYDVATPSAGMLCAIINIAGTATMVIANDACVKGGAYFPLTVKKHLRALHIAKKFKLNCLYLVDSAGAYLPQSHELFCDHDGFGRIFYEQAHLRSIGIKQIAIVLGSCTAGGAYVPGMADETIMIASKHAHMYLAGPALVKAAIGQDINAWDLGGHKLHAQSSGVSHHTANDENHAFELAERLLSIHAHNHTPHTILTHRTKSILTMPKAMHGAISCHDRRFPSDMMRIIHAIIDPQSAIFYQPQYATTLICCYAKIAEFHVGIIANQGALFHQAACKGKQFIDACQRQHIPLISLQDIPGFMVGPSAEASGIISSGAAMVRAMALFKGLKMSIITGGSHGAGNYAMGGRAFDPHFLWTWPNAQCSIMSPHAAGHIMNQIGKNKNDTIDAISRHQSALSCTARLFDDGIIEPRQTRYYLANGLALYYHKQLLRAP